MSKPGIKRLWFVIAVLCCGVMLTACDDLFELDEDEISTTLDDDPAIIQHNCRGEWDGDPMDIQAASFCLEGISKNASWVIRDGMIGNSLACQQENESASQRDSPLSTEDSPLSADPCAPLGAQLTLARPCK